MQNGDECSVFQGSRLYASSGYVRWNSLRMWMGVFSASDGLGGNGRLSGLYAGLLHLAVRPRVNDLSRSTSLYKL